MKKIYSIVVVVLCVAFSSPKVQAQEVWYDVDFSSTEWLDAFTNQLGKDVREVSSYASYGIEIGGGTVVNNLIFDGNFHTCEEFVVAGKVTPSWTNPYFVSSCGKTFSYDFRLRNNKETSIEFPSVANAGKVTVYARNVNATLDSYLYLQKKPKDSNWENLTNESIPWKIEGYNTYQQEKILECNVNSQDSIKLRLFRNEQRFMNIFRIVIEKYTAPSSIEMPNGNTVKIFANQKIIHIESKLQEAMNVQVTDILGKTVLNKRTSEKQIALSQVPTGIYIVKLNTSEGEFAQKVVIR